MCKICGVLYIKRMSKALAKKVSAVGKPGAKKEVEREYYAAWKSIPAMLRMLPISECKKMGYDVDDPLFLRLLGVTNKSEFCAEFGVGHNAPARWEAEEGFQAKVDKLSTDNHVLKFKKDVDFAFTQKVLKFGDAPRMKLWYQINTGWSEKIEHKNTNLNLDIVALVERIEKQNKEQRGF